MNTRTIGGVCLAIVVAAAAERVLAPFSAVRPVLEAMRDQLPPALRNASEATWNAWSRSQDQEIRARLEQGEIDSMIHLLLFGTSFTKRPRIQFESLGEATRSGLLRSRVEDLVQGLRSPGGNERLVFLRNLVKRQGLDPNGDDAKTGVFLFQNLQRVLRENQNFAQRAGEAALFRDRGVSLDATIFPNFAIEQALSDLKTRGFLGNVARVAVIGPGLDFTDKQSGYDYYPQQTLQPFAVYDSLVRLELVKAAGVSIMVFDISTRVLDHVQRARERAQKGRGYVIQLPRESGDSGDSWKPEAVAYWRAFGDRTGKSVAPIRPPAALAGLETRAIEVRPAVVLSCDPVNLNIVLERMNLPAAERFDLRFDLIVATNVFVYYDRLEQALALQNVSTLLKPGGILLSNDELPEIPQGPMRRAGETAVWYTDKLGTSVVWYQKR